MTRIVFTPTTALLWEIWRKQRRLIWLVLAMILFSWVFNTAFGESFLATEDGRDRLLTLNGLLTCLSIFLVFGIFNYTEFNPQKEWTGFPYHLFTLPVPTWRLVALPMIAGVSATELTFLAWAKLVFVHNELVRPWWFAVLIGTYLVFFQAILWALAGFRVLRIIVLSLVGTSLVGVAFIPFLVKLAPEWWLSEKMLAAALVPMALLAYMTTWSVIARQRTGGGQRENRLKKLAERALDFLPRHQSAFRSARSAQLWFEMRRSGLILPSIVAAILLLVIGPLSWHLRQEETIVLWILPQTLAMPVVLAAALGKGFSKPDFWSRSLAISSFIAARPLETGEMVVAKLKAAALSAVMTWMLVLAFLCLWLPFWAKLDQLSMLRIGFWMVDGHSVFPQYVVAGLIVVAGILLTWKFLVNGLCIGLSGNRKLYIGSVAVYSIVAFVGIAGFAVLLNHDERFMAWVRYDPNGLLSILEWAVAVTVICKFWLAAFSWRRISRARTVQYLLQWIGATSLLWILAKLVWADGCLTLSLMSFLDLLPLDSYRLKHFLILLAFMTIPIARLGFAASALARNRHGAWV